MENLDFVCKECRDTDLFLVRKETTSTELRIEGEVDFIYGKVEVIDCDSSEIQCENGHTLTLKNDNVVDDCASYGQWLEENEEWLKEQQ